MRQCGYYWTLPNKCPGYYEEMRESHSTGPSQVSTSTKSTVHHRTGPETYLFVQTVTYVNHMINSNNETVI